jgi:hypothetical protein
LNKYGFSRLTQTCGSFRIVRRARLIALKSDSSRRSNAKTDEGENAVLPRLHQHAEGAAQMFRMREGLELAALR